MNEERNNEDMKRKGDMTGNKGGQTGKKDEEGNQGRKFGTTPDTTRNDPMREGDMDPTTDDVVDFEPDTDI